MHTPTIEHTPQDTTQDAVECATCTEPTTDPVLLLCCEAEYGCWRCVNAGIDVCPGCERLAQRLSPRR